MENQNPYAAPRAAESPLPVENKSGLLAGRGMRLGAAMLDGIVLSVFYLPLFMLVLKPKLTWGFMYFGSHYSVAVVGALCHFTLLMLLNFHFLRTRGQTIGKRIVGIRIVRSNGEAIDTPTILKRYALLQALGLLPWVGMMVGCADVLCIFRESRKCLHDTVADTIVVNA